MISISRFAQRLRTATYFLEKPKLFSTYLRGGIFSLSQAIDNPWFHKFQFATIIDVGANTGQFATTISPIFPQANIYAFEPLPSCFEQLKAKMSGVANFVCINIGLGDQSGEIEFESNEFSPASSFLKLNHLHKEETSGMCQTQTIKVKVERLDDIVGNLKINYPLLVKIDTQGYEEKVLNGGEETIKSATALIIETSFVEIYEGQPLFDDIYKRLTSWGFTYEGSLEQMSSKTCGQLLQSDSLFVKHP